MASLPPPNSLPSKRSSLTPYFLAAITGFAAGVLYLKSCICPSSEPNSCGYSQLVSLDAERSSSLIDGGLEFCINPTDAGSSTDVSSSHPCALDSGFTLGTNDAGNSDAGTVFILGYSDKRKTGDSGSMPDAGSLPSALSDGGNQSSSTQHEGGDSGPEKPSDNHSQPPNKLESRVDAGPSLGINPHPESPTPLITIPHYNSHSPRTQTIPPLELLCSPLPSSYVHQQKKIEQELRACAVPLYLRYLKGKKFPSDTPATFQFYYNKGKISVRANSTGNAALAQRIAACYKQAIIPRLSTFRNHVCILPVILYQ